MSSKQGKKRASPGADIEKGPLDGIELSASDGEKLQAISKKLERVEIAVGMWANAIRTTCGMLTFHPRAYFSGKTCTNLAGAP
jgi:hypothetical protein